MIGAQRTKNFEIVTVSLNANERRSKTHLYIPFEQRGILSKLTPLRISTLRPMDLDPGQRANAWQASSKALLDI